MTHPTFISSSPLPPHLIDRAEMIPYGNGSFVVRGKRFDVLNARGTIGGRQDLATKLGVIGYVEQHLNANRSPKPNYASAHVAPRATRHEKSVDFAAVYTAACAKVLGIPNSGVIEAPSNCARMWKVPAFLAEPAFLSNPDFAAFVKTGEGTETMARLLANAFAFWFPGGGLVGLSVGHAYRGNNDPGAPAYRDPEGEEDPAYDDEAEIADGIVNLATELLVSIP